MDDTNQSINGILILTTLTIFLVPIVVAILSRFKRKKIELELLEKINALDLANSEISRLNDKYGSIIDLEQHTVNLLNDTHTKVTKLTSDAEKMQQTAEQKLFQANEESQLIISKANSSAEILANSLTAEAKDRLKAAKEKADIIVTSARVEAEKVIDFANRRAEEIAGDALEAKAKADQFESAIRAMKNTIEGYKDDYIIPNHAVLDDLAEEYSFKEAGEQLKSARKRVRDMVKNGFAGDCDYVEAYRKNYAIHFAVDAFNGKVDSALAKVKHDNFGKIKQEILDAYALVNHNGAAFRNACIRKEFLEARLEELRWAVAAQELRKIELEEQREIRERMREEEKARKEIEKAIKEAEKEERMLQKALDVARKELAAAHGEERQIYETQLAELEQKLKEAEAKGERAMSMAQQTRRGHVYVISNIGSFGDNIFKIGMTRRLEPNDRVKELGDASVPFEFDIHAMIYCDDAPALEKALHQRFDFASVNKVNPRKEFFNLNLAEIKQAVEQKGIKDIHWTMKAAALEYRESKKIAEEQLSKVAS
ncbi:Chromosome segregation ATPase [Pseudoalteromonas luteoviolacea B = ATCC 29581]|nr:Chromosome segregation ATPase [Pseudoalteromonas luteoviolacea B = ATCC 29581]